MTVYVLIAIGGGLGASLRWVATLLLPREPTAFPTAITLVNVAGSLALGLLVGAEVESVWSIDISPLTIGLLGGFTTFSTWMVDIDDAPSVARSFVTAFVPLMFGLAAAFAGLALSATI